MIKEFQISAATMSQLLAIADLANQAVADTAFTDYQELKSQSTLLAQKKDLENFTTYVNGIYVTADIDHQLQPGQLFTQPEVWAIISAGLVETFKKHLAMKGFAVSSINRALASIRMYSKLAMKAGVVSAEVYTNIKAVGGYGGSEAVNLDDKRDVTRIGRKKKEAVTVDNQIIKELKHKHPQSDKPVGRRDMFVMCLIFDHGLRASEVSGLTVGDIDVVSGQMTVHRKKTNTTDRIKLTLDTLAAAKSYLQHDALTFANEPLILSAKKGGHLKEVQMSREMISNLINRHGRRMAQKYGLQKLKTLSSHDGRHQWTTDAIEAGTPLTAVQQAGGWKSPAMVHRYANKARIVNQDVKLNR